MDIISNGLAAREIKIRQSAGEFAYERLQHQRRIEEIDRLLAGLDGMTFENAAGRDDLKSEKELVKSKDLLKKEEVKTNV